MKNIMKIQTTAAILAMLMSLKNPRELFLAISLIVEFSLCRSLSTVSCFFPISDITPESRLRSWPIYLA